MHIPVLLAEAVDALFARADAIYVDGTFGRGGHARALLARLAPRGRLVVFDKDPLAIAEAQALAASDARVSVVHAGFGALKAELAARGIARIGGLLLDLGVSSPQLDEPQRGFSFRHDAPLDMRMDTTRGETAAEYLQRASYGEIVETLRELGEERFAAAVARALVARRDAGQPVRRTAELAQVVAGAVRTREPGQDPATRTFQALRIRVNRELDELQEALADVIDLLEPGGRLAVISFHSLEDRIVKQAIVRESRAEPDRRVPHAPLPEPRLRALGRTRPGAAELAANSRARSATLRWAERTAARPADAAASVA